MIIQKYRIQNYIIQKYRIQEYRIQKYIIKTYRIHYRIQEYSGHSINYITQY